ncbi:hypothetical protein EB75_00550 [Mycobacterium sp. ST-F2]|uniref:hypothetical protein n=1 Tax=Mycobacterium sp. ST-F2 TaxID=1490484 RepID=UPI00093D4C7C|nr:hypothetical protein [Mycobacterium sp. ST-F2]OKH85088.1 hypothetical protein EB75_00550 [Mycobacterium sp. ST-F2]
MKFRSTRAVAAALVTGSAIFAAVAPAVATPDSHNHFTADQVKAGCEKAGGTYFPPDKQHPGYGCYTRKAVMSCAPDGDCLTIYPRAVTPGEATLPDLVGLSR